MTLRVGYEIRKTKLLLWKDHAHPAMKALVVIIGFFIVTAVMVLFWWKVSS